MCEGCVIGILFILSDWHPTFQDNAFWAALNMLAFAIVILIIIGYIIFCLIRCCAKCCRPAAVADTDDTDADQSIKKSNKAMVVFKVNTIIGILVMFFLSLFLGIYGLAERAPGIMNSPSGAVDILRALEPKLTQVFVSSAANVAAPALTSLNETITSSIDIPALANSMQLLNDTMPHIPDIGLIVERLRHVENITGNATALLVEEMIDMAGSLSDDRDRMAAIVNELREFTVESDEANAGLAYAIVQTNSSIDTIEEDMEFLFGADGSGGLVGSIRSDLIALQRAPDGIVPSTDTFDEASDGSYGTTPRLVSGAMEGDIAEIDSLVDKLTVIYTNMTNLPNYTETAESVMTLNVTIMDALAPNGAVSYLLGNLTAIQDGVVNYPDLLSATLLVSESLELFNGVLDDLDRAVEVLEELDVSFSTLPGDLQVLKSELEDVRLLNATLDGLLVIKEQLLSVNESLVKLPNALGKITDVFDDVKDNANDVLDDLDGMLEDIDEANTTIMRYLDDGRSYVEDMREMRDRVNQSLTDYDLTSINDTLNDAISFLAEVNFNVSLNRVYSFQSTLLSVSFDDDLVTALRSFEETVQVILTTLRRTVDPSEGGPNGVTTGDYLLLQSGYCSNSVATYCTSNVDCGAGTCSGKGTYRCAHDGSIACNDDDDCTGGYCLADSTVAGTLHAQLNAMSSSSGDIDLSSYLLHLDAMESTTDLDLSTARYSLNKAYDVITVVNLTEIRSMLDLVSEAIDSYNATGALDDLDYNFDDLGISEVIDIVEPLQEDRDELIEEHYPTVKDYTSTMWALHDFLYGGQQLRTYIDNLAEPHLHEVVEMSGPTAMLRSIAEQVDLATLFFHENQNGFKVSTSNNRDSDSLNAFKFLDRMGAYEVSGYGDMVGNGAVYYIVRLFNMSTVFWNDPKLKGIFANSDDERYENGKYCVTSKCEDHTQDVVHNSPLSEWHLEFPQYDMSAVESVDYSTQELLLLVWVFPLILVVVGATSLLLAVVKMPKGEKCCNACFLSVLLCQLPLVLLLTGFLFFIVTFFSKVCDDWDVVGRMYITEYGDQFCHDELGGKGTNRECTFDFSVKESMGGGNVTITIDVLDMYGGIFQNQCGGNDPFASLLRSLSDQLEPIPTRYIESSSSLDDTRNGVMDILVDAGDNVGFVFHEFMYGLADDVLNCEKVSGVIASIHSETCVSVVGPMMWIIAPWYLCAWIMLCCGLPAACLKAKAKNSTVAPERQGRRQDSRGPQGAPDIIHVDITTHYCQQESTSFFIDEAVEGHGLIDSFSLTPNVPPTLNLTMMYRAVRSGSDELLPPAAQGNFIVYPCSPSNDTPLVQFNVWLEGPDANQYSVEYCCITEDGSRTVWYRNKDLCPRMQDRSPLKGLAVRVTRVTASKQMPSPALPIVSSEEHIFPQETHKYEKIEPEFDNEDNGLEMGRPTDDDDEAMRI